jgi:hypothetical protein
LFSFIKKKQSSFSHCRYSQSKNHTHGIIQFVVSESTVGEIHFKGNGTLDVTGATLAMLNGGYINNAGNGNSSFRSTSGNVSLLSSSYLTSVGNLTGTVATNLLLINNSRIVSSAGTINMTVGKDITISGTAAESSYIQSALAGNYLAGEKINLSGISAANRGYIQNAAGYLLVRAGTDIDVNLYGRIVNMGARRSDNR